MTQPSLAIMLRLLTGFAALLALIPDFVAAQSGARWSPAIGVGVNTALGCPSRNHGPGVSFSLVRGGRFRFGAEVGYQGLGTEVTRIENFDNQPGAVYREEFSRSMLRLVGVAQFEAGMGRFRPYLIAGAGGYDGRWRDRIRVTDGNGQPVPFYDFDGSGSDVKAGLTAGVGVVLTRPGRRMGFGIEGRWHGILDVTEDGFGTADFLSVGGVIRW
ncbi:MAG: hypothetical protein JNJ80_10030 [Gemmatimonadetes bacterium]|nr:hypothetical protein [Gemmatimonadota bacterium]MCC7134614.1 hypothetical protein [Gemmatimonadales bacterium]